MAILKDALVQGDLVATGNIMAEEIKATTMTADSFNGTATYANTLSTTLPVNRGGTGAATFTSGAALIGSGTSAVTTRSIRNNTATSSAITADTNLITSNTLRYAINRTTSVAAADTNYTTVMARGISLRSDGTYAHTNGTITFQHN